MATWEHSMSGIMATVAAPRETVGAEWRPGNTACQVSLRPQQHEEAGAAWLGDADI